MAVTLHPQHQISAERHNQEAMDHLDIHLGRRHPSHSQYQLPMDHLDTHLGRRHPSHSQYQPPMIREEET